MEITELKAFNDQEFEQVAQLMMILDSTLPLTREKLQETISHPTCHLHVMRNDNRIIGCYTLCIFHSPTGKKASVEDVVVHTEYQGQHLGKELMAHAIAQLKEMAPIHVQLTSRPSRVAANKLYRRMGFMPKETNVYVMNL